ncbi:MAG: hypothetical protein JNK48_27115 [Bryobacterales bacterium]|nr:hypothetical protein [Bryobacterales bacterium]
MKKLFGLTALSALLFVSPAAAQSDTKDRRTVRGKRMENQQKRIEEGVKEGSLTKKEAVKLEAKEAALAAEARKDRKDGAGMTAKEKAKINSKQNKLSREIYKEKHDAQTKKQ